MGKAHGLIYDGRFIAIALYAITECLQPAQCLIMPVLLNQGMDFIQRFIGALGQQIIIAIVRQDGR
jgi:hypothetical protein